jgi:hypothetical protein
VAATYRVYVDWDGDGTFAAAADDVTDRVLDNVSPVTMRYGRDQARALSPTSPGEASFVVNNRSRDYSPENTGSPLAGKVLPGRQVKVTATSAGSTYTLFQGQLDDFKVQPDYGQRYIDATCLDPLGLLVGVEVSTGMYAGIRTGDAVHRVLDAVGWPADLRDIDPGATVMPWWWLDDVEAFTALSQLADSEGPSALITVDSQRRIVFRDRHHRILDSASLTAQATWRSGGVEPTFSTPADYNHGWKEIINSVRFDVPLRAPGALGPVWTAEGIITVADGETVTIAAKGTSPFFGALVPEQDTDYTLLAGTITVALTRDSGESTGVVIQAVGGTAQIDGLQVRAVALNTATTAVVTAEDSTSIASYGRRSLPDARSPVWAGPHDARAIAQLILAKRADRVPTISVTFPGGNPSRLAQQFGRNLSDRVRVIESHTGLNADCYIEQISHTIGQGGLQHSTTFGLEKAAGQPTAVFVLGVAGRGVLGTNQIGRAGLDDPATVFVLGADIIGTNLLGY